MKTGWQKAALGACSLAALLALGACGQRVENTQMPQPEHASVEINRQGEPGSAKTDVAQPKPGPTAIMGAGGQTLPMNEDQRIAAEIQQALHTDPQLNAAKIEVLSEDGLVTLRGSAPDPLARDRAGELARGVSGVKTVDNMLTLG